MDLKKRRKASSVSVKNKNIIKRKPNRLKVHRHLLNYFNMALWIVKAPSNLTPNIPKGFTMQVVSGFTGGPSRDEIEEALKRNGITAVSDISWASPGNWKITKV